MSKDKKARLTAALKLSTIEKTKIEQLTKKELKAVKMIAKRQAKSFTMTKSVLVMPMATVELVKAA